MTDAIRTSADAATVSSAPRSAAETVITVIEPEPQAPLGRLREWLSAQKLALRMVRPEAGDPLPTLDELGDGLVVLGGPMSAHAEDAHPWIGPLRGLLRDVVDAGVPTVAICLGAQIAAEAVGGTTASPSPHGTERGVVDLELTDAAATDPLFSEVVDEAVRAAVRAGIPTQDGTRLPVLVSHDDGVVNLPETATLLASSAGAPVQAWRVGRLLALQHHPESTPARMERVESRVTAWKLGAVADMEELKDLTDDELPAEAVAAGRRVRADAERAEPVVQAFGRALARVLARQARAYRLHRGAADV
ncbi:type 1 glutamine amidotransferase [Actinomyces ruminicola]|uniref:GMP synthase-Glutamine amidotransferase n=1 Tax=Actinomyces ruminicola TaxID=332524 RepID=A0A1G9UZM3_9ACTO|nr:type 1 glutamine amidotransferase [Actinomyces ruminicola]SDM65441.1 GMP synthase-Glutamine amidotransferase [Actinomyces ruminicola]